MLGLISPATQFCPLSQLYSMGDCKPVPGSSAYYCPIQKRIIHDYSRTEWGQTQPKKKELEMSAVYGLEEAINKTHPIEHLRILPDGALDKSLMSFDFFYADVCWRVNRVYSWMGKGCWWAQASKKLSP